MWHRLPRYSLARRIVLSVGGCLVLVFGLYVLVALWSVDESTEAAFRERLTVAKVVAERVDNVLEHELDTLQAAAATLTMEPARELTDDQRHRIAGLAYPLGDFRRIAVANAAGTIVYSASGDRTPDAVPNIEPERLLAMRSTGQPEVTEIGLGAFGLARLLVPLTDGHGTVAGALVAELDPADQRLGLLPRRSVDGGVVAQLMDADGRLLAGLGVPGPRAAREHAVLMADLVQTGTPGYRIHEPGPGASYARHVVAYAPVAGLPAWGVAVEQPIDEVLAIPRQVERRLATTGVASFALIIALAWLDVRRIIRPLRHLTEAAERIAQGQLDTPLASGRSDELGLLARAFETMRLRLKALLAQVQDLAVIEERERIAREMHDGVGQVLGYVNTKTLAVSRLLEVGKIDEARAHLAQLESVAKDVYADVREAILGLHTTLSDEQGLSAALDKYIDGFERQSGIDVDLDVSAWPKGSPLPLTAEVQLVRIVQEALANVRKHANAEHATVTLAAKADAVHLSVADDGHGFDPERLNREGWPRFGLQTMRERAEGVGGTFTVVSRPDTGTRVEISIPAGIAAVQTAAEV